MTLRIDLLESTALADDIFVLRDGSLRRQSAGNLEGQLAASAPILSAIEAAVSSGMAGLSGGLQYQGLWDADANNPPLPAASAASGHYYEVGVAGTTDLDGQTGWQIGDRVISNGVVWERVAGSGHSAQTDNPHGVTAAQVGLGAVDNTPDADKPVSDAQAVAIAAAGQSALASQSTLARLPQLVQFDFVADFTTGAYLTKVAGRHVAMGYGAMFHPRLPEPLSGAGLAVPDSASATNKCLIGANDTDFQGVLSANDLTATIVEVADLPSDVAQYFGGLGFERVFHLVNEVGGTETMQSISDAVADGERTASAYVWAVSGTCKVSTGASPHSDAAVLGGGARISATANAVGAGAASMRVGAGGACYVAGIMLEEGAAVSPYEDAYQIRNRVEPRATIVGGAGTILCQVLLPVDQSTGSAEIFGLSNAAGDTVLRCVINWDSGGSIVLTADDGTTSGNANRSSTWTPTVPTLIAASYDAAGVVSLSTNGSPVETVATGVDLSGLERLRIGGGFSATFQHQTKFLDGNVAFFAYKGEAL